MPLWLGYIGQSHTSLTMHSHITIQMGHQRSNAATTTAYTIRLVLVYKNMTLSRPSMDRLWFRVRTKIRSKSNPYINILSSIDEQTVYTACIGTACICDVTPMKTRGQTNA